jgi:ketosteroid isomerase-like protein
MARLSKDIRAIGDLVAAYARALDKRDWPAILDIFTEDATAYEDNVIGPEAIAGLNRERLAEAGSTMHFIGHQTIAVDGDTATAVSQIRVFRIGAGASEGKTFEIMGEYHDELRRTSKGWRIFYRQFDRRIVIGKPDWLARPQDSDS